MPPVRLTVNYQYPSQCVESQRDCDAPVTGASMTLVISLRMRDAPVAGALMTLVISLRTRLGICV